ncbi:hypothetical protein [Cobetia sp. QF-1]|uniref:hypothetical protein n=1 Tax=Cobetia sp. QF-1 TaxID=1969833 RepID=UPI001130502C|nr:hypothetical protein [Cobetia sp. QF-1]
MPVFQRSSYSKEVDYNVISLFDPGLLVNESLTNAWFCGTPARYHADYISSLLKKFFNKQGVKNENILVFGTSAGGLPALKIAQRLPGSTVWAGNIQTIAFKHSAFPKMIPVLYPNKSHDDCVNDHLGRFDAREMLGNYRLIYFQNKSDKFHFRNHYLPFKSWCEHERPDYDVHFYEYDHPESGHGSVGKKQEIEIIHQILSKSGVENSWSTRC